MTATAFTGPAAALRAGDLVTDRYMASDGKTVKNAEREVRIEKITRDTIPYEGRYMEIVRVDGHCTGPAGRAAHWVAPVGRLWNIVRNDT